MQITITIDSTQPDSGNVVSLNGVRAAVTGLDWTGTEKQVQWAQDILSSAIAQLARAAIAQRNQNGLYDAADLAARVEKTQGQVNAALSTRTRADASTIIDARSSAQAVVQALA